MELREEPFFSVIVPTYNMEKYIYETLDSVKNQSFDSFEVIVVDDGSTDHTLELCRKYAEKDNRFKVYHQENQGPMIARKTALSKVQGTYCLFLDSDDWFDRDLMKIVYQYIQETQCDMVIFNSLSVYKNKIQKHGSITEQNEIWSKEKALARLLCDVALYSMCAKAIKRTVIEKTGQDFYQPLDQLEDYLQSAYYINHSEKIGIITDYLYRCRRRGTSLSSKPMSVDVLQGIWSVQKQAEEYVCKNIDITEEELFQCHTHVLCDFMGYIYRMNQNHVNRKEKIQNLEKARKTEVPERFLDKRHMRKVAARNRIRVILFQKRYFKSLILMDKALVLIQRITSKIKNMECYES